MHKQKSRKCKRYIRKRIRKALEEIKNTEYKIDWLGLGGEKQMEDKFKTAEKAMKEFGKGMMGFDTTEERVREIVKEELNSFFKKVEQNVEKITTSLQKEICDIPEA